MSALAESWFYHRLAGLRTIRVSEDGVTWAELTLSDPRTVRDALSAWEAQANAHPDLLSTTYTFSYDANSNAVTFACGTAFELDLPGSLPAALGFSAAAWPSATSHTSDKTPAAIAPLDAAGYGAPRVIADEDLREYRMGRAVAITHYLGRDVGLDVQLDLEVADVLLDGPLLHGKVRLVRDLDDEGVPGDGLTLGNAIDCFPYEWARVDPQGDGNSILVEVNATLDDEGATDEPAEGTLAHLAAGLPYGYGLTYVLKIEGIPVLFAERDFGAAVPAGYTLDASLVIDESAAVGSEVDRREGIGRGYDLHVKLLDTSAVRGLFRRPEHTANLTADLPYMATTADVDATDGWPTSGTIYVGNEAIPYVGTGSATFNNLARGTYGKAYTHQAASATGTIVTSGPRWWIGRRARLYAVGLDPYGQVLGDNLLDEAVEVWTGHINTAPRRDSGLWMMRLRSIDRRLDEPLVASITGRGEWHLDSDPLLAVESGMPDVDLLIRYEDPITGEVTQNVRPWQDLSVGNVVRASYLRQLVVDTFTPTGVLLGLVWRSELVQDKSATVTRRWVLYVQVDSSAHVTAGVTVPGLATVTVTAGTLSHFSTPGGEGLALVPNPPAGDGTEALVGTNLWLPVTVTSGAMKVYVDEGDPEDIPTAGWVILESEGNEEWHGYTSTTVDPGDPGAVTLRFQGQAGPDVLTIAHGQASGDPPEVTVRFAFRDAGDVRDTMRRMLMSSGRGDNSALWDTLPATHGYDIEDVDAAAWDEVMSGPLWQSLTADLLLEGESSFTDVYGGLLSLAQLAVAPVATSSGVQLAPVRTGLVDSGVYTVTIRDWHLARPANGEPPVRTRETLRAPNVVAAKLHTVSSQANGTILVSDKAAARAQGVERWEPKLYGFRRNNMLAPVYQWAFSLFATGQVAQVVELDVVPWLDVDTGDPIYIDCSHPNLWQWSSGSPGYTGFGRVLGRRFNLATGLPTLVVMIEGILRSMALSPSAPVEAWAGADDNPTHIDLPLAYLPVLEQFLAEDGEARLQAYLAGDDEPGDYVEFDTVSEVGGYARIHIIAHTGFTLADDWHLTVPLSAECNDTQLNYLHTDSDAHWS